MKKLAESLEQQSNRSRSQHNGTEVFLVYAVDQEQPLVTASRLRVVAVSLSVQMTASRSG